MSASVARCTPPRREQFLVFGRPVIDEAAIADVVECLRSGWVGSGPRVERFEHSLAAYVGVPHVRCLSSCTGALFLALKCLGVGPGDEVIVPAMTFVASANAVEQVGARTVLVDSEPHTGLLDLDAAAAAVTGRTAAVMPVHLAGRPLDMDQLGAFQRRFGLAVIEDAAHALGAQWRGRQIGTHGNLTAYSFYATKNITTVEGGALATEDAELADRIERLALHGLSAGAWQRYADSGFRHYEVVEPGFKLNMTDLEATLGLRQLERLDEWIDRRAELWAAYDDDLGDLPLELPPPAGPHMRHARHLYRVTLREDAPLGRDALLDALAALRIGVGVHYRGVHLHPYYRERYGLTPDSLPVASAESERTLSLPLSPALTEEDRGDVVAALRYLLGPGG